MTTTTANSGCLGQLLALFGIRPPENSVNIASLLPVPRQSVPSPASYGFQSGFRDNTTAIAASRAALAQYRETYKTKPLGDTYPLRVRIGRHTGMPIYLTGFVEPRPLSTFADLQPVLDTLFANAQFTTALFGVPINPLRPIFKQSVFQRTKGNLEAPSRVHAPYQQWYKDFPVFGGGCVVHLVSSDARASITNSYFPIHADAHFDKRISESDARAIAALALALRLGMDEGVVVLAGIIPLEPNMPSKWERLAAIEFVKSLSSTSRAPELNNAMQGKRLPDLTAADGDWLAAFKQLHTAIDQLNIKSWDVSFAKYMGQELVILPFIGVGHYDPVNHNYHLAYQVSFVSPRKDESWRVFVDAMNGDVLGEMEELSAHALTVNRTSDGSLPTLTIPNDIDTEISQFMDLKFADGTSVNVASFVNALNPTPAQIDAAHIAVHSRRLFDRFSRRLGMDQSKVIRIPVTAGLGGNVLDMHFTFIPTDPINLVSPTGSANLSFQTDEGGSGLDDGRSHRIHAPSRDPEVIYHEFTHAYMWMLNASPFVQQSQSVPFARALVEGYANYFARGAAAALNGDGGTGQWARGAYSGFGNEWDFARANNNVVGSDVLPAPNLYPSNLTSGYPVYDTGMVWGRSLWDIRTHFGADPIDQIALDAFLYLHGWVSNFEIAAEGLIDQARNVLNLNAPDIQRFEDIFAARGILADRGIQALEHVNTTLFAGNDFGVWRSDDSGTNWQTWGRFGSASDSQKVVALKADGTTLYAATEEQVFHRGINDSGWQQDGTLGADQAPLSLAVEGGTPYIGTGRGVLRLVGGIWRRWENRFRAFEDLALSIVVASLGGSTNLYDANFGTPMFMSDDGRGTVSLQVSGVFAGVQGIMSTVIARNMNTLFVGTLAHGTWSRPLTSTVANWNPVATQSQLNGGAVLGLHWNGTNLWTATTKGVFNGSAPLAILPLGTAIVTRVHDANGVLMVGTADGKVLVSGNRTTWTARNLG